MDEPALVVDCTGMRCPMPVIELTRRLADVEVDEVIGVVADDPAAKADVPAWCRLRGHEYVGARRQGHARLYLVRRTC
ncbi:MAG: sulfurtransferase TusA family protein [Actinomycetota bacterium]|nr:sulfurtransferase TusA family protein [Actinomycetota bacterium]